MSWCSNFKMHWNSTKINYGSHFRGHLTTMCIEFCYCLTPRVDKNRHFLTPSHPHLVHVVIEWPLKMSNVNRLYHFYLPLGCCFHCWVPKHLAIWGAPECQKSWQGQAYMVGIICSPPDWNRKSAKKWLGVFDSQCH